MLGQTIEETPYIIQMWIPFEVITVYKYMKNVTILRGTTKRFYQSHVIIYFIITKPTRCTNFSNLFLNVSDSLCVHHQEFFTVHTAICIRHTGLLTACEQDQDGTS